MFWNISVKYYTINKFYETISMITNKKGHQKLTLLGQSKKTLAYNLYVIYEMVFYTLLLELYLKNRQKKK